MQARLPELEGDFSLNAANVLSADLFLRQELSRLAPTHDLNAAQLAALARNLGPERWGRFQVGSGIFSPFASFTHSVRS